jgi:dTDP-glucose 4,6-dehydratase
MDQRDILKDDLLLISERTEEFIKDLIGSRILITGGTGFLGTWILISLVHLNKIFSLSCEILVLSRSPSSFLSKHPYLIKEKCLTFIETDILKLPSNLGSFTHVIHGAADTSLQANAEDVIVEGTLRLLEIYGQSNTHALTFLSSGAVYGEQPLHITSVTEDCSSFEEGLTNDPYGNSKRLAEKMILDHQEIKRVSIARCFAFLGPFMHFNRQFAIGNFIKSAIEDHQINLNSDGTSIRTFLYAADFSVWILKILLRGKNNLIMNVGSDFEISIKEVASLVSKVIGNNIEVSINPVKSVNRSRYVPSINKARKTLDLDVWTDLETALKKTSLWYKGTIHS